jgi:UDP-glucose 4-epimerase
MNILITGGAGFIGSNLCKSLIYNNKISKIIVIDNLTSGRNLFHNKKYKFLNIDISNYHELSKIPRIKFDIIFHFAGQSSGPLSHKIFDKDFNTNLVGTVNILKFMKSRRLKKIVFSSSMSIYGNQKKTTVKETDQANPISVYAINKLMAENYIKYFNKFKINFVILRLFSVYGIGQDLNNKNQGMLSIFFSYILKNKNIIVRGSINRFRDFIYIDDLVFIINDIINNYNKYNSNIINVGTGKKTNIKNLIKILINEFGKKNHMYKIQKETKDDQKGIIADNKKLLKLIPNLKFTSLVNGVKKMKEHYQSD